MRELRTEIEIAATAERVWSVLTDFAAYPSWNPLLVEASGTVARGEHLKVKIKAGGKGAMTFKPEVMAAEPNRELRWRGKLIVPGIFDGEHRFVIEPMGEGRVRFVHAEQFGGLLVPLVWSKLEPPTRQGFEEMNRALKRRAEEKA